MIRATSGVWLKGTQIVIFPSLFNCETQSVLLNVTAVNEVVRHVTSVEYQLYKENGTTITSSSIWLNSSKHAQASDYARSLKHFPMALESAQSEQLHMHGERQSLTRSSRKEDIFRAFSSKVGQLKIRKSIPREENASFTGCVALSEAFWDSVSLMHIPAQWNQILPSFLSTFINSFILPFMK